MMGNIVLIGMPGCGKSTIGQALAHRLGWGFADADAWIERREQATIPELFDHGEEYFRDAESRALNELARLDNLVIATGGGAVKRRSNVEELEKTGTMIYLFRPLEQILDGNDLSDRPLLAANARKRIYDLYAERRALYESSCHVQVDNTGTIDGCVDQIISVLKARAVLS